MSLFGSRSRGGWGIGRVDRSLGRAWQVRGTVGLEGRKGLCIIQSIPIFVKNSFSKFSSYSAAFSDSTKHIITRSSSLSAIQHPLVGGNLQMKIQSRKMAGLFPCALLHSFPLPHAVIRGEGRVEERRGLPNQNICIPQNLWTRPDRTCHRTQLCSATTTSVAVQAEGVPCSQNGATLHAGPVKSVARSRTLHD